MQELGDDIRAHEDEIREVTELGKKLLASGDRSSDGVKERNDKLTAEVNVVAHEWAQKRDWIKQCLALQIFNKEADHIDAATSGSEMFLEYTDLGVREKNSTITMGRRCMLVGFDNERFRVVFLGIR